VITVRYVPYLYAMIFFVTILIIYCWLGVIRSFVYTDTMQGIALFVGVIILFIGSVIYFGSVGEATEFASRVSPEKIGVPDFEGVVSWFSMLILVTIGAAIYPHAIQRIYAAGSELNLKRSLTWMAWAPFLTSGVVFLIGIIGIK